MPWIQSAARGWQPWNEPRPPVFGATVAPVGPSRDAIGDIARWRNGPVTGLTGAYVGSWPPPARDG